MGSIERLSEMMARPAETATSVGRLHKCARGAPPHCLDPDLAAAQADGVEAAGRLAAVGPGAAALDAGLLWLSTTIRSMVPRGPVVHGRS